MTASVRVAPLARPTPLAIWARATMAMVKVSARPTMIPNGRRLPPSALAEKSAGRTGRTQGVIAVPAPATKANSINSNIWGDDAVVVLRAD